MKTYAETKGNKPFNWLHALSASRIDTETWGKLRNKANQWPTCACGNMCAVIPRKEDSIMGGPGEPIDPVLYKLGMRFSNDIANKRKKDARKTFYAIEDRSLELIREINKPAAIKVAKKVKKLMDELAELGFSAPEIGHLSK